MGVEDDKSLSRHATTPLKAGGGAIFGSGSWEPGNNVESDFCATCFHSLTHQCQALLTVLWLLHCHLSLLRVGGVHPAWITGWAGCSTSIQPGKLPLGPSPLSPFLHQKRGTVGSTAGSLSVNIRVADSSLGSSVGAASSADTSAGVSSLVGHSASGGMGGFQIPQLAYCLWSLEQLVPQWAPLFLVGQGAPESSTLVPSCSSGRGADMVSTRIGTRGSPTGGLSWGVVPSRMALSVKVT